ncbi:MAG TPA: recombinase family protein [Noviherbaspirillum sp.]|nr:recombinase family protein [Noviherbaspirillum sp.]
MTTQRIGYIRVSTIEQNTDRQLDGVQVDKVYTDRASGKDTNRPQFQAALQDLREGDTLVVHSMDRMSRSVEDMRRIVRELTSKGVSVQFIKESMTFTGNDSPMNTLMLTMLGAFAEFERSLIRERQREGIAIAKAKKDSPYKGRKPALTPEKVKELREKAATGAKKTDLAKEFKISRETLYQYLRT